MIESKHTTVQKQTFNSHLTVREGRPPKISSYVSNPAYKLQTPWGGQKDEASKVVTPANGTLDYKGRRDSMRSSKEECLDQWRKKIGKTSLLYSTKIRHTVRGDSTSQGRDVDDKNRQHLERKINGPTQLKLRVRDPDVANSPDNKRTGSSKVPEPETSLHVRNRKKSNKQIQRSKSVLSISAPKAAGVATRLPLRKRPLVDATQTHYNGNMATPKLNESRCSRLPKSSLESPPSKPSVPMVARMESVNLADKSSKRKYSAAIWALAKKEAKRLKRENTSNNGQSHDKTYHSTANRNSGTQSNAGKIVGTPDPKTTSILQNDTTTQSVSESPNKITSHKKKASLCPSGNAVSVTLKTFNGKVEGGDIEGKHMGVRFSDQTVDKWCSHLADKWTTNARRNIDGQEEVKGTYRPLTEPVKQLNSNKSKQRMTQVVEVTMLANGVEEVLVTNKVTDPSLAGFQTVWLAMAGVQQ